MLRRFAVATVLMLLLASLPVAGHAFNHGSRHSDCEVDAAPDAHFVGDGHPHTHDASAAAADGLHNHDPCKQIGMQRPSFTDAGLLDRVMDESPVIAAGDILSSSIITDSEAFLSDVQDYAASTNFIAIGDEQLAAHAAAGTITGSGTASDPYVIENKLIRNVLWLKDTSACVVIRDNVVHSRALIGPLLDPADIIDLAAQRAAEAADVQETSNALEAAQEAADSTAEEIDALQVLLEQEQEELAVVEENLQLGNFEAMGIIADTQDQLAQDVVRLLRNQLQNLAGRLILDWNGQCVHVYNNIVEDLRVNRNNARAGFATGGLIEDNRIYHIGQIRHYDGEFRENEVGFREHLWGHLPHIDEHVAPIASWRAINGDGFNQGWYHHNLIFGSVDLDYHGHHHGAGFFAPESHYHGVTQSVAYMMNGQGGCLYEAHDYGDDTSVFEDLRSLVTPEVEGCLAHHDHRARWTSAVFEENTVIDPLGYGIRYEDRNHQGDDRFAASESMRELDVPHVHRSSIAIDNNVVLGSIWVDIFNSPGIDVWSDDFTEVRRDLVGQVQDAALHLGAKPIPSHPERNNGWFSIQDNVVYLYDKARNTAGFHYGWAAYQINHAFEADAITFDGNKAVRVPYSLDPEHTTDDAFIEDLEAGREDSIETIDDRVNEWGTHRDGGPTSFAAVVYHLKDSTMNVCDNAFRGFDVGFYAWDYVYDDSDITLCDNDYGTIENPELVRLTATPADDSDGDVMNLVQGFTDGTSLEPLANSQSHQVNVREAWLDATVANGERIVDNQLLWAERTTDNQLANIDRIAANQMYWADYQAAHWMGWSEWQVGRNMDQADYQAARAMSYVDWAQAMADQYTHGLPMP